MEPLPSTQRALLLSQGSRCTEKRYANFKVFYNASTPIDYEAPGFKPGDVDKDRWYIMTHAIDEIPERYTMGKLDTGHHRYAYIPTYRRS